MDEEYNYLGSSADGAWKTRCRIGNEELLRLQVVKAKGKVLNRGN